MPKPIRRVVTATNDDGVSIFVADGAAPTVYAPPGQPNGGITDLWVSHETPASNDGPGDLDAGQVVLSPPSGGSIFRVVQIPPDAERTPETVAAYFEGMAADHNLTKEAPRHPGFHTTDTLDYLVVLEGEVWALLDEDEVLLKQGDVMIQRGTSHGWSNRTDTPCLLVAVLVDALPPGGAA